MKMLLCAMLFLFAPEREKTADYPVRATAGGVSIGAENNVRSVFSEAGNVLLPDYLVVEVGFEPAKRSSVLLSGTHFTLRVNGRKTALMTQTPGMVAASLKYGDWEQRPTLVGSGGIGNAGVILGRPRTAERFPGDQRPQQGRLPPPPKAPGDEDRAGIERQPDASPDEIVVKMALPEGETSNFVRGYLYFPFRAKTTSIKKLELLYSGPSGEATLVLQTE